jgi:hypothetical protein
MQKIVSLFKRNDVGDRLARNEVTPGAEWVLGGEGVATIKWDGTCCMMQGGVLYRRYDGRAGKELVAGFVPAQPEADPITGHWPGWLRVGEGPEDQWHREGLAAKPTIPDGTYELVGPKVQGNPYKLTGHVLWRHGKPIFKPPSERTFAQIRIWLESNSHEGIVWHHRDGSMVKVKRKDFGFQWPVAK